MPTVQLRKRDVDLERLPRACMRCGGKPDATRHHTFFWASASESASQLSTFLLYMAGIIRIRFSGGTRSMTVPVPLCSEHKYLFHRHALLQYGGLLIFLLLAFLFVLAAALGPDSMDEIRGTASTAGKIWTAIAGSLCMIWPLIWLTALGIISWRGIRATEITDDSITLTNVSQSFADKVKGR